MYGDIFFQDRHIGVTMTGFDPVPAGRTALIHDHPFNGIRVFFPCIYKKHVGWSVLLCNCTDDLHIFGSGLIKAFYYTAYGLPVQMIYLNEKKQAFLRI